MTNKDLFGHETKPPPENWEEFCGREIKRAGLGVLLDFGDVRDFFPIREVHIEKLNKGHGTVKVYMPRWLAKAKGLIEKSEKEKLVERNHGRGGLL